MTSLAVPRCHAGVVTIQNRLYLVGGRSPGPADNRVVSVDTIDRYNDKMDEWQLFAKLRVARHDASCAAVGLVSIVHVYYLTVLLQNDIHLNVPVVLQMPKQKTIFRIKKYV